MAKIYEGNIAFNPEAGTLVAKKDGNWNAKNVKELIALLAERKAVISNWMLWVTIDGENVLEYGKTTTGEELLAWATREDANVALVHVLAGKKGGRRWPQPKIRIAIGNEPKAVTEEKPSNLW